MTGWMILGGFALLGLVAVAWALRRTAGAEAITSTAGLARGADLLIRTEALVGLEWAARKQRPLSQGIWSVIPEVSRRGQLRLQAVAGRLENGDSLYDALSEAPKVFPGPLRRMLAIAAERGVLELIVPRVAARGRASHATITWAAALAVYPIWGAAVAYFLLQFIAPKIAMILESVEVTDAGMLLAESSAWVVLFLPIVIVALLVVLALGQRGEGSRAVLHAVGWRVPIARSILEARWWADAGAMLAALLQRGVPEADAFDAVAGFEGPLPARAQVRTAAARIREGEPFAVVMPSLLPAWTAGRFTFEEAAGGPVAACEGVARFAAERRDRRERRLALSIYPISAVVMGVMMAAWLYHGALLSVRVSTLLLDGSIG